MKHEVNIMEKEKLEQYKNWMCNLSFFNNHSFIIENIENLWQLTNYIEFSFSKYIDDKYNDMAYELKNKAICIKDDCANAITNILK